MTDKITEIEVQEDVDVQEVDEIPSHEELLLDRYVELGLVLVQWVGSKTIPKIAPSPTGASRSLGIIDYGLVNPRQWLMVHKDDAKDKRYYRRPTTKEKPDKSEVSLHVALGNPLHIRVTW